LNSEELAKRDAEFFAALAKDKTLTREKWNKSFKVLKTIKTPYQFPISPEHLKKTYTLLQQYCEKFPNVNTPNLVFSGATGTGKTFAATTIRDALKARKFRIEYTTAFGMVNAFFKFDVDHFINCDLLIIDDLGSEPVAKNISQEYIYAIINERLVHQRPFIITTNLDPVGIMERYDQRIASRILAKETSTVIAFTGKDLRLN